MSFVSIFKYVFKRFSSVSSKRQLFSIPSTALYQLNFAMSAPFPSPTKTWHTKAYDGINPTRPELSLAGRSAFVTGAGGSIGAAIVRAFAQAGVAHIALVGRRIEPLNAVKEEIEKSYSTQALVLSADITNKNSIDKALASFREHVGKPLDILVSNAGFLGKPTATAKANAEEWWQPFTTNVLGSFLTIQGFIPVATSNATIINISSAVAHVAPLPDVSAYAASKAATAHVVDYLQHENPDLRIYNLHPGVILSDMNRESGIPAMDEGQ